MYVYIQYFKFTFAVIYYLKTQLSIYVSVFLNAVRPDQTTGLWMD